MAAVIAGVSSSSFLSSNPSSFCGGTPWTECITLHTAHALWQARLTSVNPTIHHPYTFAPLLPPHSPPMELVLRQLSSLQNTGIFNKQWQSCSCTVLGLWPPMPNSLCISFSHLSFYTCLWSSRNTHIPSARHAVFAAGLSRGPNVPLFVSQVLQFPVRACLHIPLACT